MARIRLLCRILRQTFFCPASGQKVLKKILLKKPRMSATCCHECESYCFLTIAPTLIHSGSGKNKTTSGAMNSKFIAPVLAPLIKKTAHRQMSPLLILRAFLSRGTGGSAAPGTSFA